MTCPDVVSKCYKKDFVQAPEEEQKGTWHSILVCFLVIKRTNWSLRSTSATTSNNKSNNSLFLSTILLFLHQIIQLILLGESRRNHRIFGEKSFWVFGRLDQSKSCRWPIPVYPSNVSPHTRSPGLALKNLTKSTRSIDSKVTLVITTSTGNDPAGMPWWQTSNH